MPPVHNRQKKGAHLTGNLERRIFRLSCGILFTLVSTAAVAIQFLDPTLFSEITMYVAAIGYLSILVYSVAKPAANPPLFAFAILTIIFLGIVFFSFNGIEGSVPLAFVLIGAILFTVADRHQHWKLMALLALGIGILLILDILFPDLTVYQKKETIVYINRWIFFILFTASIVITVSSLKSSFDKEKVALADRNAELEKISYVISHDLKGSLRGIGTIAEWITEDHGATLDAEASANLAKLKTRVGRMQHLIEDILAFLRLGQSNKRKVTDKFERYIDRAYQELDNRSDLELKKTGEYPLVVVDPDLFTALIREIMTNAILHHYGEEKATLEITATIGRKELEFRFKDNGPGISPEFHERIFGIFQTLEAPKEEENTGIGLAVAKKIVELHGGRIWVESKVGSGTTFVFTLPKS